MINNNYKEFSNSGVNKHGRLKSKEKRYYASMNKYLRGNLSKEVSPRFEREMSRVKVSFKKAKEKVYIY